MRITTLALMVVTTQADMITTLKNHADRLRAMAARTSSNRISGQLKSEAYGFDQSAYLLEISLIVPEPKTSPSQEATP